MLSLVLVAGCSTPKNVIYFQDAQRLSGMMTGQDGTLRLRPGDKVNIVVNSANPMLEQQFTLVAPTYHTLGTTATPQVTGSRPSNGAQAIAYTVDEQGTITFPELGKIRAEGKTRRQLATYIQDRLRARELVMDAIVSVEYVNMGVNVLGEVKNAGRIDMTRDEFTVIDALAYAGDMTIDGDREHVLVARQTDGVTRTYILDLTNMQQTMTSEAYYLQQNDLVYVAPNKKRKREAKSTGNTFNNPSIWISIASLITTIVAVATR